MSAHDFEFTSIDGKPLRLSQFAGHPVLIVNTASQCGLTPQYKGLEALWRKYKDRGLVVLGVPSNDFGAQEPGTESEIKNFCSTNYGVTFPMTAKNPVIGPKAHPLYKWAVSEAGEAAAPRWNFHKYLIGSQGELAGTFGSKTPPDDAALTGAIETALNG
ncbi:MAG TPA: glutathione peroxidase [Micropepsaceae bacterium]|jgi:glutathione peroxidase|nr:glutathione peroxidase [Micropepsaceae bacterium]